MHPYPTPSPFAMRETRHTSVAAYEAGAWVDTYVQGTYEPENRYKRTTRSCTQYPGFLESDASTKTPDIRGFAFQETCGEGWTCVPLADIDPTKLLRMQTASVRCSTGCMSVSIFWCSLAGLSAVCTGTETTTSSST